MLPRFFLVLGHQSRGQMLPAWPGGGRQDRPAAVDGDWVAWRLVGSNHRELARSANVFPDAAAARECLAAVQAGIDTAIAGTEVVRGRWGWQLSIDDVVVGVSSRLYQRSRECADSVATATASIRIAELRDGVPPIRR